MGSLRASLNKYLLDGYTKNAQERRKQKGKDKRNTVFESKEEFDLTDEASIFNKVKFIGLTRESAPTVRKETIQRKVV